MDYDPRSKQFLVGSLKHSTISAVGPDGTAYVVDELNPTVFRIDSHGHTSAFLHSKLPAGAVTIPNPLSGVSSRLLTGKPAVVARVRPHRRWNTAAVTNTNTVSEPVTDSISAGPGGSTHALSGGLAALLTGKPDDGFVLTPVRVQSR
ncbi:hypothetical protein AB0G54_43140 [Streptomyces yokosukanensis]|uniref:hypothetical protein n=1 Tax=Streptomyces yokosukanensis TaxID=67386 RepID=UPI00342FD602